MARGYQIASSKIPRLECETGRCSSQNTDLFHLNDNDRLLVGDVRHQANKPGSQDCLANGSLINRRGSSTAIWADPTFPVNQLTQRLDVLVIDVDWTWNISIGTEAALHFALQASALLPDFSNVSLGNAIGTHFNFPGLFSRLQAGRLGGNPSL